MDDFSQRLQRLEEAHAFAEHATDQLAAELQRAFSEIESLRKRLAALEQSSAAMNEPADETDASDEW